jgi:glucose-6-phosphate isomerase
MTAGLPYELDIADCLGDGGETGRLSAAGFESCLAETAPALERLRDWHRAGDRPFLALPARRDDLDLIEAAARRYHEAFDTVVVLGTGGSSLGGQCLAALSQPHLPGIQSDPRVIFMENVDPTGFNELFRALDLPRTGFIVISKSGGTAETLAQFLVCLDAMRQAVDADRLGNHFTIVTRAESSPLRRYAEFRRMRVLVHDADLGGRYSALSVVGLLPAMIVGLDPVAAREGAAAALDACLGGMADAANGPAAGAALQVGLMRERAISATAMMSYGDRFAPFGMWFRQLWAESLGKKGLGTVPIRALGTVDQHSQLQLYLDGPNDKLFTMLYAGPGEEDRLIAPESQSESELDWLIGRSLGELLEASYRATSDTLVARGRPVRRFVLPVLDARAMGAMMMHFMLETVIAAHLLGVDPFDQPAVEQGKTLTRRYMTKLTPRLGD